MARTAEGTPVKTIRLPYDPEGAYIWLEEEDGGDGTWVPMLCPGCNQGYLAEERIGDEWLYTCWSWKHPMYACHTQWVVEQGRHSYDFGTWDKSVEKLTSLGILPLF